MRSFTHNELAQYNGQEGRPAYISGCVEMFMMFLKFQNGKAQKSTVMFSAMIYQMSPINKQPKSVHQFQNFQLLEN